jgi:uncharacterized protein
MKTSLPCIVIDTNVLISAGLLPGSKTAQVVALALTHFVLAQNEATWSELESRIKRAKFDRYFGDTGRQRYMVQLAKSIQSFDIVANEALSIDTSDDKFVSLAIDAGAKILISGDSDLKEIKHHKGIEMMSPAQFFDRMSSATS